MRCSTVTQADRSTILESRCVKKSQFLQNPIIGLGACLYHTSSLQLQRILPTRYPVRSCAIFAVGNEVFVLLEWHRVPVKPLPGCTAFNTSIAQSTNERTPFLIRTKCKFLTSTNIKWASPTVLVHVYHRQTEHHTISQKPLLFVGSLVCSTFAVASGF